MEGGTVADWLSTDRAVKGWVLLVLGVVLVLLLLVVLQLGGYIALKKTAEGYSVYPGTGLGSKVGSSTGDNTQRHMTVMSSTNQVPYNESTTFYIPSGNSQERLVSVNTAPDFWTVTDVLGEAQEQDRTGRGELAENQYWSPDLQQWLTSGEVAMLPEDQKKRVQFYGGVGQNPSMVTNAAAPAAAAEHMRGGDIRNFNSRLGPVERMTPEDIMMKEMFSGGTAQLVDNRLASKIY